MYSLDSRAARRTIGIVLMALAACADEPVAPGVVRDLQPNFGVGDVIKPAGPLESELRRL